MITNLKKKIKEMEKVIDKMIPPIPETQQSTGIIYQTLPKAIPPPPPPCKTCGHECQGHKRPKGLPVQCPACPNGICSTAGKSTPSKCSQHNSSSGMRNSLRNPGRGFKTNTTRHIKLIILDSSQRSLSHKATRKQCLYPYSNNDWNASLKKKLPK